VTLAPRALSIKAHLHHWVTSFAPLFERSASGMTLSAVGKRLMPLAMRTLEAATELVSSAKRMQGQLSGTIKLGTIIDPKSIRLGELLSEMKQRYPALDGHARGGGDAAAAGGTAGSDLQRLAIGHLQLAPAPLQPSPASSARTWSAR